MLKTGDTQVPNTTPWPHVRWLPLRLLFSRQYWWATLVVVLGMVVLARLGIWQLDRLEQRKARNAEIVRQLELPPLSLTDEALSANDLAGLKNRRATARGEFDFSHQVALLYQNLHDTPGIHLITPLVIEGSAQAVLVDRGWVPIEQAAPENWPQFDEPDPVSITGPVSVTGLIRLSETLPGGAGGDSQRQITAPQSDWYRVDITAIQSQVPYDLLPVYILQSPPEGRDTTLPYEIQPEFDLSNGSHLSYAIQWFAFALILGVIYVRYISIKEASQVPSNSDAPQATQES